MASAPESTDSPNKRLVALDVLRGLVMVLMTIDHADMTFSARHFVTDSVAIWRPGTEIPVGPFLTRWVTHLCAPTFLFLVGVGVAMSAARRRTAGSAAGTHDRHLLTRGVLLMVLDPLWMWWAFGTPDHGIGVLFCIGACMALLVGLRRLSSPMLVGLALAWFLLSDVATYGALQFDAHVLGKSAGAISVPTALLFTGGGFDHYRYIIVYPLVPWTAIACLGLAFGRRLQRDPRGATRTLLGWGLAALAVFAVVRGIDGYGNLGLHRDDASPLQWLHVSKYPPSLTFVCLELGLMALVLAAALRREAWWRALPNMPLVVFGQCALFFYLLHVHLLWLAAQLTGQRHACGLGVTYLATLADLVVLYPLCLAYRALKRRHPRSALRLV